ncbi:alpha/beta hydrolase [Mesobacterium pallidum]|uniref:alpha/beta hydrolase n=1 Tax=Mesobacterium pallidum TaxID=2872037 RepID=UPI001EE2F390|nr:alpha/beta hydrolase [Mesobacterium pallidum]
MATDQDYNNVDFIPGGAAYPDRWLAAAEAYVEALGDKARLGIPYGDSDRQKFDLFLPETEHPHGLMIFVHGGYWIKFDRSHWSHLAEGARARGWAVAMPSYDLCPDVRISAITDQVTRAIETAAGEVGGPMVLAGHSAGGHLVARMLEPLRLSGDVAARLRHVMPISPVSDLRPLLDLSMNDLFMLTHESAADESPMLMQERLDVPVSVWVGSAERPVFLDQARWLAEAWGVPLTEAEGLHHFNIIEGLSDPRSRMIEDLFSQVSVPS